ncbi:MAG: DUF3592 domain-containing protein [Pseudomonadota bacterium]
MLPQQDHAHPPREKNWSQVVFGIIWTVAAIFFTASLYTSKIKQWRAHETYVAVQAEVIGSSLRQRSHGTGTGKTTDFRPMIRYSYSYQGRSLESEQVGYIPRSFANYQDAKRFIEPFAAGSTAIAYVDPHDPSEAVIDNSPPQGSVAMIILGLATLAGVALVAVGLRGNSG